MRSTLKLVVPFAVAALALGACGTKGGDTSSAGSSGGAAKAACDQKIGMGVTDRIVVLEFGRKIAEGAPAEIRDNPAVIAAYLGVDEEDAS